MWSKLEFNVVQSHGSQTSPDFSMVADTLLCNLFQSFVLISFGCFVYPRLSIVGSSFPPLYLLKCALDTPFVGRPAILVQFVPLTTPAQLKR